MASTILLISGANTGIGYEIAKRLLTTHENITLYLGSRNPTNGTTAASTIKALPTFHPTNKIHPVPLDITSDASITSCIATITSQTPHIDVLINNAGVSPQPSSPPTPQSLRAAFNSTYDTNVTGTFLLTEACLPLLSASPQHPASSSSPPA